MDDLFFFKKKTKVLIFTGKADPLILSQELVLGLPHGPLSVA